ncbi:glycosyltransferase family 4 protein [Hymenobacter sp. BT491]|uniref:glycosyltransferase family 4 protein n=1 Tax=Hymenobacter sp. BT491 TaxID=2766779 RepID=UPI0016539756|nr:glycosyltransferase family 4 protein [Hymenobacter sp. BT491]MBC6988292.1 glycosyltransferase family 4 protein [Hymenobacter sp. BT491]
MLGSDTVVLFISHDATRTGAPIVLLHLLRWLKRNTQVVPVVLLQSGGELEEEFRAVGETHIWSLPVSTTLWQNRYDRLTDKIGKHKRRIQSRLKQLNLSLIYANTVVSAELGIELKSVLNCPLVCHVHELQTIIQESVGKDKFTRLSTQIDHFLGVSEAVCANLRQGHEIPAAKISKVFEFVPVLEPRQFAEASQQVRQELGIPADAFLALGAGTLDWRKSPALFIQIAQHLQHLEGRPVYCIWMGGQLSDYNGLRVYYDLERVHLENTLRFVGSKANPHDYINAADVFVLTSREDPYPLVCLEAASLHKPVLCFADSGGMPEFVSQDCGIVVPYLRSDLMAQAIVRLRDDAALHQRLGTNAALTMRANHTVDTTAPLIHQIILRVVTQNM